MGCLMGTKALQTLLLCSSLPISFLPPRLPAAPFHPPMLSSCVVTLGVTAEERLPRDAHVHTLHHAPGVLPGLCHLVADLHLFGAADYCKREVDLPATEDRAVTLPKRWRRAPAASARPLLPQASPWGERKGGMKADEGGGWQPSGGRCHGSDAPATSCRGSDVGETPGETGVFTIIYTVSQGPPVPDGSRWSTWLQSTWQEAGKMNTFLILFAFIHLHLKGSSVKQFSLNYNFMVLVGLHFTWHQIQIFLKKKRKKQLCQCGHKHEGKLSFLYLFHIEKLWSMWGVS